MKLDGASVSAGFEEGIRTMKPGGKRRIVIPPELGPPVCILNSCNESRHLSLVSALHSLYFFRTCFTSGLTCVRILAPISTSP